VRIVEGPRRDAYAVLDEIEEQIGLFSGPVLLCLGPSATVLADAACAQRAFMELILAMWECSCATQGFTQSMATT
jgi:hypothetical protein